MSELSLQDTGVDLQRLKGQDNYVRWSRDFKVIAEVKGVWKVVTEEEPILTKPLREDYFQSFKAEKKTVTEKTASRKSTRLMDKTEDGNTTEAEETKNFTSADFSARISEYKLDLEEYEKNNKRVRIANALIAYWIDPAIRAHPEKKNQDEGKKDQREDKLKQDGERKTKKPSVVTAMATINLAKFKDLLLQSAAFKATSLTILKQLSIMSTFPDPLREVTQADLNPQALSSKPEGDQLETSEG
ncbi:hypothetical protein MMC24_007969 [Lignoscripta atroalba]|nr:hypothetical protein [Lignoscripta atroalba]